MNNLKSHKRKNYVATTTFLLLETILIVAGVSSSAPLTALGSRSATGDGDFIDSTTQFSRPKAPVVLSGDNIYIAWWTNNTENGNEEVMFRASNDGGATFGDKINLSNTTDADSWRVEIAGEGESVVISWWETNQTSDTPVARVSADGGATFGPILRLAANGTIDSTAEEEVAAEAGDL